MPGDPACRPTAPGPKPPPVQIFLQQALNWQSYLSSTPGLTQSGLARELKMNRVRVTQILNLLRLALEIQQYILAMPPTTAKRAVITENRLRALVAIQDQRLQVQKFRKLLGAYMTAEAVA